MNNRLLKSILIVGVLCWLSCTNSNNHQPERIAADTINKKTNTQARDTSAKPQPVVINPIYNEYARYIAGLNQPGKTSLQFKDTANFYKNYCNETNQNWEAMDNSRLSLMRKWRTEELAQHIYDSLPLFYPFSGPDFLHAFQFFPTSARYIFMAGESVGIVPEIDKMDNEKLRTYLSNNAHSLKDIYRKSYFITKNMAVDLNFRNANGVIPVLMMFLARTNNEILNIERVKINTNGLIVNEASVTDTAKLKLIKGVRITFRNTSYSSPRELIYFQCDLSDKGFVLHPELTQFITTIGCANCFVKSASYLMHYPTFSSIRNAVKQISQSILQDDTGIAVKYLSLSDYKLFLYGRYTKPVRDFSGVTQPRLDSLYRNSKDVKPLPFSLGYHWWGTDQQNYMLIQKNTKCVR